MPAFNFIALDTQGKRRKGVLEADHERYVRQKLREQGLLPLKITSVTTSRQSRWKLSKKIKAADLALIFRQLATLLNAGIPLDETLATVANQSEKSKVKSIMLGVRSKVLEGYSLAAGMNDFKSIFPKLYCTTVAAGEKSGKLDQILLKLAEYTERQQEIQRKIRQALIYPLFMTFISLAVVSFLLIDVVPKIVDVFAQTEQTLPLATIILLAISHGLKQQGIYFLIGTIVIFYFFKKLLKKPNFRFRFDHFLLKLPIIGKNIRLANSARFARTFGILNAAGVSILEAMQSAAQLITPLPMQKAVLDATEQVRKGISIHRALSDTHYFSPLFIHLVASGEKSGQLETMLLKAAAQQENDVETLVQSSLILFEPLMILFMGGVVLFIVLAILLPIFALEQVS